jgi:hypothetical protein
MENTKIGKLVDLINEIFTKKLALNFNYSRPTSMETPFNVNELVCLVNFSVNKTKAIVITLDKDTAKKFHEAIKKKINNEGDDIHQSINAVAEALFINIIMKFYKAVSTYKEKLYSIKTYEVIEPEELYFINSDTIKIDVSIENIVNVYIYYVN